MHSVDAQQSLALSVQDQHPILQTSLQKIMQVWPRRNLWDPGVAMARVTGCSVGAKKASAPVGLLGPTAISSPGTPRSILQQ